MLQQIINIDSLREDMIEGVSEILDRELTNEEKDIVTSDDHVDIVMEAMFKSESEMLHRIAKEL